MINEQVSKQTIAAVAEKHDEDSLTQITRGVEQVARRWRETDGSAEEFQQFCVDHFLADETEREVVFQRFIKNFESLKGNLHKIYRDFNWMLHVDAGEMLPLDHLFANYDVHAHVNEDMFKTRLAFVILLNFPLHTLVEKSSQGQDWSRRKWAETRLVEKFADRIPGDVKQQYTAAYTAVESYVYNYNIYMGNVLDENSETMFPKDLKLISHWGLRDELKGQYANEDGHSRQEMIYTIMERIITQEIPAAVINNPDVRWQPESNRLQAANGNTAPNPSSESGKRYEMLLKTFAAERLLDPHTPDNPTLVERRFNDDREILETEVEALLSEVLSAPVLQEIAALVETRLGRKLRPYDIWFTGFISGGSYPETELDRMVQSRYPNVTHFKEKISEILTELGFTAEKAKYLQKYIEVDPSRGAGHAMGGQMRYDNAHLRTRVPEGGMNYKGFNTAMHELGHTVEQVISMNDIDYYSLEGVPNTAFTEAFAFVFQARDMAVLGLESDSPESAHLETLHNIWQTMEIAGVSLLDMKIWRWMYQHPDADAASLQAAVISLAKDIWNQYFAPVFGCKDSPILAIYSHIIFCGMYIPDYAIGHIIAFQIEDYLKSHSLATEMERMCKLGCIAPQVWMKAAVGTSISVTPMVRAAEAAIAAL